MRVFCYTVANSSQVSCLRSWEPEGVRRVLSIPQWTIDIIATGIECTTAVSKPRSKTIYNNNLRCVVWTAIFSRSVQQICYYSKCDVPSSVNWECTCEREGVKLHCCTLNRLFSRSRNGYADNNSLLLLLCELLVTSQWHIYNFRRGVRLASNITFLNINLSFSVYFS